MANPPPQTEALMRSLPAIQRLLEEPALRELQTRFGREAVLSAARETLASLRAEILAGTIALPKHHPALDSAQPAGVDRQSPQPAGTDSQFPNGRKLVSVPAEAGSCPEIVRLVAERVAQRCGSGVRRVINATGVILHTGLGRAVLPQASVQEIAAQLSGYSAVEVEIASGKRGHRDATVNDLLRTLLGCERAIVVNNNSAGVMLALAALARGKEVIVSRGQLVEIGGSFRIPDVMRESGCTLVEVGTTNRTYVRDYEAAITPATAALLLVHASNFRLIGFTEEPAVAGVAALARSRGLPLLYDIGSGALLPGLADELKEEPIVKTALDDGADLVLFSADKILGSTQGGVAVGKKELVEKMRRHPLYRALRLNKLTLCALESTLRLYLDPEKRLETVPTLRMLRRSLASIGEEAAALATRLSRACSGLEALCVEDSSRLGSGSLPERNIPTRVVSLRHAKLSADELGAALRAHEPPIFTRIQEDRVLIDPRTLLPGDADEIEKAARGVQAQ